MPPRSQVSVEYAVRDAQMYSNIEGIQNTPKAHQSHVEPTVIRPRISHLIRVGTCSPSEQHGYTVHECTGHRQSSIDPVDA
jgi:hypothetical protein